ncbi:MAG: prephenate dehydrogenase [Longimicrobiales bacterium]
MSTVAILGLGLMGGSLAHDLAYAGHEIVGFDRAPDVLRAAHAQGVVHDVLGPELQGLQRAEIVVLAVPVNAAVRLLRHAQPRLKDALLVSDVGSTKRAICALAETLGLGARFVGSHPFAGDHRSGWDAARAGLFRGARVFLCPVQSSSADVLDRARAFWEGVGGQPQVIDAETHDELLAWSSHLPQFASSAVALALAQAGVLPDQLGRGGRDVTRLAASDPDLWTDVALQNADHISAGLAALQLRLQELRTIIDTGNEAKVRAFLGQALRWSYGQRSAVSGDSAPLNHNVRGKDLSQS